MTDRIFTDANGRKYINNEPRLHPPQRKPLTEEEAHALIMQDYCIEEYYGSAMELIRRVEQAHGIGEKS